MADLTPQEIDLVRSQSYWDERYAKAAPEETFDWLFTWEKLRPWIEKRIPDKSSKILMLGCGNSSLSADMYLAGYENIINVDFSAVCIAEMQKAHADKPKMQWVVADVMQMDFLEDGSIDVALDKATLDAFLSYRGSVWDIPEDIRRNCDKYVSEVYRVLKAGHPFLCISFRQPHFIRPVLERPDLWSFVYGPVDEENANKGFVTYYGFYMVKGEGVKKRSGEDKS